MWRRMRMTNLFNRKQIETQTNTIDSLMKTAQIEMLKKRLTDSDYKVIKCQECVLAGIPLPYNIDELHNERQTIRDQINKLQAQIQNKNI